MPAAALLVTLACVTINVYFPEAEIRDLSQRIEEEVRERAGEPSAPEGSFALELEGRIVPPPAITRWMGTSIAWAQGGQSVPEPEVSNPAIRKIIASRAQRLDQLNRYKASGVLGEANNALIVARDLQQVGDLRERAEVQRLIKEENDDRQQLFREIAAAKGVDSSQMSRIQETYAETLRQFARAGDWIQRPDGGWEQVRR